MIVLKCVVKTMRRNNNTKIISILKCDRKDLFVCGQRSLVANTQTYNLPKWLVGQHKPRGCFANRIDPMISVPLGRSAGETAPVVCVETPDCDGAEAEPWRVNHSHSTGCLTGCRPRYFPSCLPCRPDVLSHQWKHYIQHCQSKNTARNPHIYHTWY